MKNQKGEFFKNFEYDYGTTDTDIEIPPLPDDFLPPLPPSEENGESKDNKVKEEVPFVPKFETPEGMVLPETKKHADLIEKTALFLSKQNKQMEIVIKTKQKDNPLFDFLSTPSPLHRYYKHLLFLISTGLYAYNNEEEEKIEYFFFFSFFSNSLFLEFQKTLKKLLKRLLNLFQKMEKR